jgi:hypothetical protein
MNDVYTLEYPIELPNRMRTATAEILRFPARPAPKQQERPSAALLEWLDEADYNWIDAPSTFDR